jgi:hypothetical protein
MIVVVVGENDETALMIERVRRFTETQLMPTFLVQGLWDGDENPFTGIGAFNVVSGSIN